MNRRLAGTAERRRIAVVMLTGFAFGRRIVRGIHLYAATKGRWDIGVGPPNDATLAQISDWRPHGMIAWAAPALLDFAARHESTKYIWLGPPDEADPSPPTVMIDEAAVGRMAAEHLLQRGHSHFAFVGSAGRDQARRGAAFRQAIEAAGHASRELCVGGNIGQASIYTRWGVLSPTVVRFFAQLPKPVAVFAANDGLASASRHACDIAGLQQPEEVAILGVDNDHDQCEMSSPALSSIAIPWEPIGQEAAAQLDDLLSGGPLPAQPRVFKPTHVEVRRSTELAAVDDTDVASALHFIWHHASDPIQVDDVAAAAGVSRTILYERFAATVGRTPLEELQRVRIDRAKRLLRESDFNMPRIAALCGFGSAEHLSVTFRRVLDTTPTAFRRSSTIRR